jgi:uncharacterized integral membrane protein
MSEDRTRSGGRPEQPGYGRVGPVDPREDPVTRPAMPLPDLPLPEPARHEHLPSDRSAPDYSAPDYPAPDYPPLDRPAPDHLASERSAPDLPARRVYPADDTVPVPQEGATVRTRLPDLTTPIPTAPGPDAPTAAMPTGTRPAPGVRHSRAGGLWTGLIASAVVLILLLVFILQNGAPVVINFLGFSGALPTGVALLFAAVAGLLLVAIPGGLRMLQLRRAARRGAAR